MCQSCGKSSCSSRRHCSAVDVRNIKGDTGTPGKTGDIGPQGPPGASGGLIFANYLNLLLDFAWSLVLTVIPGTSFAVVGDGNYQVHVCTSNSVATGAGGQVRLYVNGINVNFMEVSTPNPANQVQDMKEISMVWRGNVLNGQIIELRTVRLNDFSIVSNKVNILINKET